MYRMKHNKKYRMENKKRVSVLLKAIVEVIMIFHRSKILFEIHNIARKLINFSSEYFFLPLSEVSEKSQWLIFRSPCNFFLIFFF